MNYSTNFCRKEKENEICDIFLEKQLVIMKSVTKL